MPARAWQRDVLANFYTGWLIEYERLAMGGLIDVSSFSNDLESSCRIDLRTGEASVFGVGMGYIACIGRADAT
jgi:hypothetical protein